MPRTRGARRPIFLTIVSYPPLPVTYDLTSNTFSHVNIYVGGDNVTLLINNADTAGVQSFSGWGQNAKLATAGSTLDLSHTTVAGFSVTSTNALGTAFTVGDLGTAFQIAGGSGQDTIVATRLHLQRGSAQRHLRHRLGGENRRSAAPIRHAPPSPDEAADGGGADQHHDFDRGEHLDGDATSRSPTSLSPTTRWAAIRWA